MRKDYAPVQLKSYFKLFGKAVRSIFGSIQSTQEMAISLNCPRLDNDRGILASTKYINQYFELSLTGFTQNINILMASWRFHLT